MKLKTLILFFICYGLLSIALSQNSLIKGRYNIKVAYSKYQPMFSSNTKPGNWRVEINYGIVKYLETGFYFGYSRFYTLALHQVSSGSNIGRVNSPFYGINANLHILPLIVKQNDFRFDLYLMGKFGGNYYFTQADYFPTRGHRTEYGFGFGFAFYPWKHTGFYIEPSLGKYSYYAFPPGTFKTTLQPNLRFGITFKFRNFRPNKNK